MQAGAAGRRPGKFRYALTKRPLQATIIVFVIAAVVFVGGLYVWQVYGTYAFPVSYCGINTGCHNTFNTMSDCTTYVNQNSLSPAQCVRVTQNARGFDALLIGLAIFAVSGITGLVIIATTTVPLEALVKTSL